MQHESITILQENSLARPRMDGARHRMDEFVVHSLRVERRLARFFFLQILGHCHPKST